jgi:arginase
VTFDILGVPFDGMGRAGGQANAAAALRAAGLLEAVGERAGEQVDLRLPPQSQHRSRTTGLLNETALLEMVSQVRARTVEALGRQHFPLVYGGDCSVLLGTLPALSAQARTVGLVFLDGHEDATPMEASSSGEAANMEIAILLGRTGEDLPAPLQAAHALLRPDAVAVLGPRDRSYREPLGVASIADVVWFRADDAVAADPAGTAREAAAHVSSSASDWWLHVDLDVLSKDAFGSCGAEGEPALPGGLSWSQLTAAVECLLLSPGCRGWSLAVYNPDLDHDGGDGRAVVELVAQVLEGVGQSP